MVFWEVSKVLFEALEKTGELVKDTGGMTIAGAVFLSIFIWGTLLATIIMFFLSRKGVTLPFNCF